MLDAANGGKFLIVSLLQAHVFDALLDYFIKGEKNPHFAQYAFDLQLIKLDKICNVEDSKFVSYLLSVTKRAKTESSEPAQITLKMGLGMEVETISREDIVKRVKIMQYEATITKDIKEFKKGQFFQ